MFLIEKEKEVHEFQILKQFNYFDVVAILLFFWMNAWTVHIFEFDCLWMLKLLALERMMGKGEMLSDDLKNHKIDSWSKKKQWKACRKKGEKERKASRKSQ